MLDIAYEYGLKQLRDMIQRQAPDLITDFNLLQQRLLDCLADERRFGQNPNMRAEKSRVLDLLMQFTSEHFGIQFIDLCRSNEELVERSEQQAAKKQSLPLLHEIWKEGTEIRIQGSGYLVHELLTQRWASDRSALYQQARGQQIGTDCIVWIKQVQLRRATSISAAWHATLEREKRLLDRLERQTDFPRRLAFEQATNTVTLLHSALQGHSWAQVFGLSSQPLNTARTHLLLRSALALCNMLKLLHSHTCSHRALAPQHIILLDDGRSLLQDVGLAAWKYEPGEGPELYRAPEQRAARQNLDLPGPRSDIYQLGSILYHIITGQIPATSGQPLPVHTWNEELSPEIDAVLQRAMAPRVKERWPTIADFSFALRKALQT